MAVAENAAATDAAGDMAADTAGETKTTTKAEMQKDGHRGRNKSSMPVLFIQDFFFTPYSIFPATKNAPP